MRENSKSKTKQQAQPTNIVNKQYTKHSE